MRQLKKLNINWIFYDIKEFSSIFSDVIMALWVYVSNRSLLLEINTEVWVWVK